MTLGESLAGRDNALNAVRLVLAASVIVGHTWPLGGFGASAGEGVSGLAVNGFFAISGYLIAGSRMRLNFWRYMWHRSLRILPAFWACLVLTAFVIAPLVGLFVGGYDTASAFGYVLNNSDLRMRQWVVGETLSGVPYPDVWNGSLWTLWFEFAAYLVAGALLTVPFVRRRPALVLTVLTVLAVAAVPLANGPLAVSTNLYLQGLRLGAFFVAGMALWALRDRVRVQLPVMVGCAALILSVWPVAPYWQYAITTVPVAYLMLALGARLPVRWGADNDVSYGVYIYGFPAAQVLAVAGVPRFGFLTMAAVTFALTVPLAWASWKLVEQPAMGLRHLRLRSAGLAPKAG